MAKRLYTTPELDSLMGEDKVAVLAVDSTTYGYFPSVILTAVFNDGERFEVVDPETDETHTFRISDCKVVLKDG